MGTGYFIYHGIRLTRQALAIRRESNRRATPLPGDNPYGITEEFAEQSRRDLASAMATSAAEQKENLRAWGEHPYITARPDNDPDWESNFQVMKSTHRSYSWCATCKGQDDGVVHQPTARFFPNGVGKPEDIRVRNELIKSGVPEDEAAAWMPVWVEEAARRSIVPSLWEHEARKWVWEQRRNGLTPSKVSRSRSRSKRSASTSA